MIFEGKPLSHITDEEVFDLVRLQFREGQHLEFKLTLNLADPEDKREVLRDITSLANSGGGYLIVGIRDDGSGKAQKFEPELVGDIERIRKSIRDLSLEHIRERILGMECESRIVETNPIVLVRVPQSDRTPHMVSFQRQTDFWTRYEDGKREMTLAEIREAFVGDLIARGLATIEAELRSMRKGHDERLDYDRAMAAGASGSDAEIITITSARNLARVYRDRFANHAGPCPFFGIFAVPKNPSRSFLDTDSEAFGQLLRNPPRSRWAGWNMSFEHFPVENIPLGIKRGRDDFRTVEIWQNGFVQLRAQIHSEFCWGQSPEEFQKQPTLNPVTISEYVVSFLRFYAGLLQICGDEGGALVSLQFLNVKGFRIRSRLWYHDPSKEFGNDALVLPDVELKKGFDPDKEGYELVRTVFRSFSLESKEIPAWNAEDGTFEFEKLKS